MRSDWQRVEAFLRGLRLLGAASCAGVLAACSTLPTQGPSATDVVAPRSPDPAKVQYIVADLTPAIVALLNSEPPAPPKGTSLSDRRGPPTLRLGVGDIVNITVFEASAGGLFIPTDAGARPGNFVTLPPQEVSKDGNVSVPFAGQVPAANRTLAEVQATIEQRLRDRAIEPQAVVTLQESRSGLISVLGDVNQSIRFSLARSGDRLLDAISRAGGPKYPIFETYVTLSRGGRSTKVYFNRLVSDPDSNVYLYPGDTIVVSREIRSFMALGASGQNGQINFDAEDLTLSQAVGKAGGVLDARGDPAQIFLYRLEPKAAVAKMGFDTTPFITPNVPVIYRVNMREPDGFFLATKFPMKPDDILFVSNAPTVELAKFLSLLNLGVNTITDTEAARVAVRGGR